MKKIITLVIYTSVSCPVLPQSSSIAPTREGFASDESGILSPRLEFSPGSTGIVSVPCNTEGKWDNVRRLKVATIYPLPQLPVFYLVPKSHEQFCQLIADIKVSTLNTWSFGRIHPNQMIRIHLSPLDVQQQTILRNFCLIDSIKGIVYIVSPQDNLKKVFARRFDNHFHRDGAILSSEDILNALYPDGVM